MKSAFLVISEKTTVLEEANGSDDPGTKFTDVSIVFPVDENTSYHLFARTYASYRWSTSLQIGYPDDYPRTEPKADLYGLELCDFRGQTFEEARKGLEDFAKHMLLPSQEQVFHILDDYVQAENETGKRLYKRDYFFKGNTWIRATISFNEEEVAETVCYSRWAQSDKYWKWQELCDELYI